MAVNKLVLQRKQGYFCVENHFTGYTLAEEFIKES